MFRSNNSDINIYINKFIKYLTRLNYSEQTLKGYRRDLLLFQDFLVSEYKGNIQTKNIKKEDVIDFIIHRKDSGLQISSVCKCLSAIKAFYKFLVSEMDFPVDVAAKVQHPKFQTKLPEVLDFSEMKTLLISAKNHSQFYYVFLSLLYYTGSRLNPIRIIKREHIDLKNKKIYFEKTKNGRELFLPISNKLFPILNEFMFDTKREASEYLFNSPKFINKPISRCDVATNLRKITRKAGIKKNITPHTIRHCTATHLTIKGVEQKFIATILGHVDLRSTNRYQQLNVENLRPSIELLEFDND